MHIYAIYACVYTQHIYNNVCSYVRMLLRLPQHSQHSHGQPITKLCVRALHTNSSPDARFCAGLLGSPQKCAWCACASVQCTHSSSGTAMGTANKDNQKRVFAATALRAHRCRIQFNVNAAITRRVIKTHRLLSIYTHTHMKRRRLAERAADANNM